MKIKAVIMSHNTPDTTNELYDKLSQCFDVTVFDSGSDRGKTPGCPFLSFENIYWGGCWNEAMRRSGDSELLWVIGGDVTLVDPSSKYEIFLREIDRYNVGCWSPVVQGRMRDIMSLKKTRGRVLSVYHLEGIAFAASKKLMDLMNRRFPEGNKLGWGLDLLMCWTGWTSGMRNILDGRVSIYHPDICGYSMTEASKEMQRYMNVVLGEDWADKVRRIYKKDKLVCDCFETNFNEEDQ